MSMDELRNKFNASLDALAALPSISPDERNEALMLHFIGSDVTPASSLSAIANAHGDDDNVTSVVRDAWAALSKLTEGKKLPDRLPEGPSTRQVSPLPIPTPSKPRIDHLDYVSSLRFGPLYSIFDPSHVPLSLEMRSMLEALFTNFDPGDFERVWEIINDLWSRYQERGKGLRSVRDALRDFIYDMGGPLIVEGETELTGLVPPELGRFANGSSHAERDHKDFGEYVLALDRTDPWLCASAATHNCNMDATEDKIQLAFALMQKLDKYMLKNGGELFHVRRWDWFFRQFLDTNSNPYMAGDRYNSMQILLHNFAGGAQRRPEDLADVLFWYGCYGCTAYSLYDYAFVAALLARHVYDHIGAAMKSARVARFLGQLRPIADVDVCDLDRAFNNFADFQVDGGAVSPRELRADFEIGDDKLRKWGVLDISSKIVGRYADSELLEPDERRCYKEQAETDEAKWRGWRFTHPDITEAARVYMNVKGTQFAVNDGSTAFRAFEATIPPLTNYLATIPNQARAAIGVGAHYGNFLAQGIAGVR